MGQRLYSFPINLAQEILTVGIEVAEIRDEIYCGIMKQLSSNPSKEATNHGWQLMFLCLATFAPSEGFENFLEFFLREHNASFEIEELFEQRGDAKRRNSDLLRDAHSSEIEAEGTMRRWGCLEQLHGTIFRGSRAKPPLFQDIMFIREQNFIWDDLTR